MSNMFTPIGYSGGYCRAETNQPAASASKDC